MSASSPFNQRQETILTLVAEGKTNREIATELHLSENTVKWYLQQIFQELGAGNRTEAVRLARQQGYLAPPKPDVATRMTLPVATTPFLGREEQVDELRRMILQPQPRLITVAGLGGVGKTRLAIEVANMVATEFEDGVFFVPLEAIDSAEAFWQICLKHLGVPRVSRTPERVLVHEYLQNRRALLVLDNTEYLRRFRSEIGWLLARTRYLQILSTSRVRLNLQAEQFYPLRGMACEGGATSAPYRLFMHVAQRHRPGFQPDATERDEIVAFCRMVEGLPLAVELAATWMDVLSPAQLAPQLRRSLNQVQHEAADRPTRQRSLAAVIDYSWQFLTEEERRVLMRLSVIRGAFSPEAAVAIGDCSIELLKSLIHSSLLQRTAGGDLKLHELIRRYGQEQAQQADLAHLNALDRHMDFYLQWLAQEARTLRETMSAVQVQRIEMAWQQLQMAWQRAIERERWDLLESCIDIAMYFEARGIWGEGVAFLERSRKAIPDRFPALCARLDEAISMLLMRLYDLTAAEKLAQHSLKALGRIDSTHRAPSAGVYAHMTLATTSFVRGEFATYEEYLQTLSASTDDYLVKFAAISPYMFAGVHHCAQLDYEKGARSFQTLIEMSEPDAYYLPAIRCMLGLSYRAQGDIVKAREQFTLALDRGLQIGVYPAIVGATYELSRLDYPHGNTALRLKALRQLAEDVSSVQTVGRVAIHNGTFYMTMGFYSQARELLRIGLQLLRGTTNNTELANNTLTAGKLLIYELIHRRQMARADKA